MLLYIVIVFLGLSIVFYCLFGGADFGAGILELFTERKGSKKISEVIGPVWEANHVWLILAITILFMGFPKIYATVSLYLHIPIVLVLIGIILRGTAFAFMHYDAIKDQSNIVYNWIFNISSLLTPLFLGVTAGAMMFGGIDPEAGTFYQAYIASWLNGFSFSVGLFCICFFTLLASIFMIGEVQTEEERMAFIKTSKSLQLLTVLSGALVFVAGWLYNVPLVSLFFDSWIAIGCIIGATLSLIFLWLFLNQRKVWLSRFTAGFQVTLILFAWFWVQHPVVVKIQNGSDITFFNGAAPPSTLLQLVIALMVGSLVILPGLFYLFRTFKHS